MMSQKNNFTLQTLCVFVSILSLHIHTHQYKIALVAVTILLGIMGGFYENNSVQTAFAQQTYDLDLYADVRGSTVTFNWSDITLSGAVITNYHLTTDRNGGSYQFGTNDGTSYTAILGTHPFLTPRGSTFEPGDTVTYNLEAYDYDRRASYGGGLLVASDTITITLPTNIPPVANAGADQTTISRAEDIVLDGSASTDPNGDILSYRWTSLNGTSISDDRAIKPSINIPNVREGSSTYAFELRVSDGLSSNTDITYVTVQNSAPVANAGRDIVATVDKHASLKAYGSYDHDGSRITYLWEQLSGTSVSFINNTQRLSFVAPANPTLLTFSLTVSDGELTDVDTVSVRVVLTSPPVVDISATQQYASFGQRVTLNGTQSSDPDDDRLSYHWEHVRGTIVSIENNRSAVAYFTAPDIRDSIQFRLTVSDSVFSVSELFYIGVSSNRSPQAYILGEITQPTTYVTRPITNINADHYVPSGGVTFTLDGSNSFDPDKDALKYQWEQTSGPTVAISGVRSVMASFDTSSLQNQASVLIFSLTVTDIVGNTDIAYTTIYVDGVARPTADAGSDIEALPGDRIRFDGTDSFSPLDINLTYSWIQTSGTTATLSGANSATPGVTIPDINGTDTLVYQLTVRDIDDRTDTDSVNVLISERVRPIANAGPNQNVDSGDPVTLNASNSMTQISGDVTYLWSQQTGTPVILSDTSISSPTFTAPTTSYDVLTFMLTLSDNDNYSDSDIIVITVGSNTPPVADAGDDMNDVMSNTLVTLSGSATDSDNDPLTYLWSQISGTDVSMWDSDTATPRFISPDVNSIEILTFRMVVTDNFENTDRDTVIITVHPLVVTPPPVSVVSDAGVNQRAETGSVVTLDGSGSRGNNLTYLWTHISGSSVTFSDSAVSSPNFTAPDNTGTIVLSLTVTSGDDTDTDTVSIEIVGSNSPPTISAGSNQEVRPGISVRLSGSASDSDNDTLTYLWTQTSGTAVTISNNDAASATFTAPSITGSLVFKLTVSDTFGHTVFDTTRVTIISSNPIADAGINLNNVQPGDRVSLDASGSYDPDGDALRYSWTQTDGTTVTLSGSNTVSPSFTAPGVADEILIFTVTVNDGNDNTDIDTVNVHVYSAITIADAGDDVTVNPGNYVTLDASGSSVGFGKIEYQWTQLSGIDVAVTGSNAQYPVFSAPDELNTLVFQLTVTNGVSEAIDTVTVTVDNSGIPVVNLGHDRSVNGGETVELSMNAIDGDTITYGWNVMSYHYIILLGDESPNVTFIAPTFENDEVITISAYIYDGGYYVEDEIEITVLGNAKPVAVIPEQYTVIANSRVILDGSGSHDPDGDTLTYSWKQVNGESVIITNPDSAIASFTAPDSPKRVTNTNSLIFVLTISDGVYTVTSNLILGVVDSLD